MPLVTRTASSGNLLVQDTEPANPKDGDLWTDLGQNPPILKLNDNGTFRPVMWSGVLVQGDIPTANAANEMGRQALGAASQHLRTNAAVTAIQYTDPPVGGKGWVGESYPPGNNVATDGTIRFMGLLKQQVVTVTEANATIESNRSFTLSDIQVRITSNTANQIVDWFLRVAGVTGNNTVEVPASTTGTFVDSVNTDAVTQGQAICIGNQARASMTGDQQSTEHMIAFA